MNPPRRNPVIRRLSATATLGALLCSLSFATPAFAIGEPTIARAVTNDDGDGHLDGVTLTFSAAMETNAPPASWFAPTEADNGFHVRGYSITSGAWSSTTALRLNVAPLASFDTGAKPIVSYRPVTGGPRAAGSGLALGATGASGVTPSDGAGPVIVTSVARDVNPVNLFNAAGDSLEIGFSEPVTLAGAGPVRAANLENAIKFTAVTADGPNGCVSDGKALSNQNFPQAASGADPIAGTPTTASSTILVRMATGNTGSIQQFVGVPKGCNLSIDGTNSNNTVITDAAGNPARPFNAAPGKTVFARTTPAPITLTSVKTTDGVGSTPDGIADGLAFTFSDPLDDTTLARISDLVTIQIAGADVAAGIADSAGIADDAVARVAVDLPAGLDPSTVSVSYTAGTCSHSSSSTTTDGIAGRVPYGSGYVACVSTFAATATDGVGPAVLQAVTADTDSDGRIDGVEATFSEALQTAAPDGWKLGTAQASAITIGADPTTATITFPEGEVADGGAQPELAYLHQTEEPTLDAAENEVPTAVWPTSDGVGPAVVSAIATDTDDDGNIDRVTATLSEAAVIPTGETPTATFGTFPSTSVTVTGEQLVAIYDGVTGSGAASFAVANGVTDSGGKPMPTAAFTSVTETIAPKGLITVAPSAPIPAGEATVTVDYTEAMADEALTVTLGSLAISPASDAEHTANGWRLDDASIWEGTVTVAADSCTESAGCSVTLTADGGHDLSGLAPAAPVTLATFIDTIAPDAAPVLTVAGAGAAGAPANVINNQARDLSVSVDVPEGQANGGGVEVLLDGASLTPIMRADVPAGSSTVTVTSAFASAAALQEALGEQGTHQLTTRLCDAATNCTTGPAFEFTVDTIVAAVTLENPSSDVLLRGGATFPIRWNAADAEEPVQVDLAYSRDGTAWTTIASNKPADGSFTWKTPTLEVTNVLVRATSRDANGNLDPAVASTRFTIDSRAPVVKRFTVPKGALPAGKKVALRWVVKDASIQQSRNPIVLKESLNGGRTWRKINAGKYSKANDGVEILKVPAGRSSAYRLRLVAIDGVGRSTAITTKTLTKR